MALHTAHAPPTTHALHSGPQCCAHPDCVGGFGWLGGRSVSQEENHCERPSPRPLRPLPPSVPKENFNRKTASKNNPSRWRGDDTCSAWDASLRTLTLLEPRVTGD
ncbi:hypothetical protein O3P69_017837 [Scylla paramamosain]|uniref:Uncharacterized protein n=1 Tax=Scylla paramamosain TaxID=85552 RepID=A0AAW0TFW5_SCYPA